MVLEFKSYFTELEKKQGVQELQEFAFCVETVNDKHTEPRFKRKRRVEYKDDICAESCLKLWFESNWYFYNLQNRCS